MKLICNFLFLLFFNYMRLDKFLTKTKIFQSRNRVLEEIKANNIKINGKIVKKGGFDIKDKYLKKGNIAILKDVTLYYFFDFEKFVFKNSVKINNINEAEKILNDIYNNNILNKNNYSKNSYNKNNHIKNDFNKNICYKNIYNENSIYNKNKISIDGSKLSEKKEDKYIFINIVNSIKWVSRAGIKLEHAIESFNLKESIKDKVFLDIGASTGGFTEVLLHYKAKLVYAVDVGTMQLDNRLRKNKNVIVMENYNAKNIDIKDFNIKPDHFVMDVSFISTKKIILNLFNVIRGKWGIVLFKPQFESEGKFLKNGIIKDNKIRAMLINNYSVFLENNGLHIEKLVESPIKGSNGNIEYLMMISK